MYKYVEKDKGFHGVYVLFGMNVYHELHADGCLILLSILYDHIHEGCLKPLQDHERSMKVSGGSHLTPELSDHGPEATEEQSIAL